MTWEANFKKTVAVVEATTFETLSVWREWAKESKWNEFGYVHRKLDWEQMNPGQWEQIGTLAGMPVSITMSWIRIEGQVVLFWELTSQVCDYRMVDGFLEKKLGKWPTWDKGRRRAHFDAMNFHNALLAVDEANTR